MRCRSFWSLPLLVLPLIAALNSAFAQDSADVRLGIAAATLLGNQTGTFSVFGGDDGCGTFNDGRRLLDWSIGLAGFYRWSTRSRWGLDIGLAYRVARARYTAVPSSIQRIFDPATAQVVDLSREFRFDAATRYVDLAVRGSYELSPWLRFSAGPSVSAAIGGTYEQSDNIVAPEDRSFADGERVHAMPFGVSVSRTPVTAGFVTALSTELALASSRYLQIQFLARVDLLSAVREASWTGTTVGIGLTYFLFEKQPLSLPIDTTPPALVPEPPPAPVATILVQGLDDAGDASPHAVIAVKEVMLTSATPLVPAVFFDSGSVSLPQRYTQLSPGEADRFSERDVAELGAYDLSHRVLDIVGLRMRRDGSARLHLFASTSTYETTTLAAERSRVVRDYLVQTWGIDGKRIEARSSTPPSVAPAQTSSDGREENRRVWFGSNSPYLLGPLVTERLIREFNPPRLLLVPTISAPAGVKRWSVHVLHDRNEIASFSGVGGVQANADSLTWKLDEQRIDSTLGELVATIDVEDSLDRRVSASDTVALMLRIESQHARTTTTHRGEMDRFVLDLAGFDYRAAEGTRGHIDAIRDLLKDVRSGASVMITGYTDRIGDDAANLALSLDRASWVADAVNAQLALRGASDISVSKSGAGLVAGRFDNGTPEGRILSRGARIVVEQAAIEGSHR